MYVGPGLALRRGQGHAPHVSRRQGQPLGHSGGEAFMIQFGRMFYSEDFYSDTGGDCLKCHFNRLSQFPMIFSIRRSILGPKKRSL